MTAQEVIAKIRAEIERQKGICTAQIKANPGQTFPFVMEMTGYDKLLSFLSTLESEIPINQAFDNNSQINILKDVIKVLTGKDTFNEAVMVSINAIQKAKKEVYQEQIAYDAYELLETSIRKLME